MSIVCGSCPKVTQNANRVVHMGTPNGEHKSDGLRFLLASYRRTPQYHIRIGTDISRGRGTVQMLHMRNGESAHEDFREGP